ncbi:MAG: FAD binding domain-containing protein [Nocardioidaceae bacterium]
MKPAPFTYHRPATVAEAGEMIVSSQGKVLAGGQSLIPIMSMRLAAPAALVDINHVRGLADIEVDADRVRIGALVRHSQLEHHEGAFAANPLLRRTLSQVAHPTIRNRGTTVGSLVHADPAGEMPAVLLLLGGTVDAASSARGHRTIGADEFFVGPLESALEADELAVSASFPHPRPGSGSSWRELARRHGDYALVGAGAVVTVDDGTVTSARLALISVAMTPVVVDVSGLLSNSPHERLDTADALEAVTAAISPEGDIHASADYRAHLARVLSDAVLREAAGEATSAAAA